MQNTINKTRTTGIITVRQDGTGGIIDPKETKLCPHKLHPLTNYLTAIKTDVNSCSCDFRWGRGELRHVTVHYRGREFPRHRENGQYVLYCIVVDIKMATPPDIICLFALTPLLPA